MDVRQQDRLIAQGIRQIRVVDIVALAVPFHEPVPSHLRQLEDVLVLALRRCTAVIPDAKADVIVMAIDVAVRRRIGSQEPFLCACHGFSQFANGPGTEAL